MAWTIIKIATASLTQSGAFWPTNGLRRKIDQHVLSYRLIQVKDIIFANEKGIGTLIHMSRHVGAQIP